MNKRILISLSVIGAVAAIAISGTVAYFSDTETSTGNVFTAGTLDLELGDSDEWGTESVTGSIIMDDMKPCDCEEEECWPGEEWYYENYILIHMKENSNPAHVYLTVNVKDNKGIISEPECEAEGGTWLDGDCSGNTPIDDISSQIMVWGMVGTCENLEKCEPEDWKVIYELEPGTFLEDLDEIDEDYLGEFQPSEVYFLVLGACLNEDAENEYQGDQSVVAFTFNAYQNEQD